MVLTAAIPFNLLVVSSSSSFQLMNSVSESLKAASALLFVEKRKLVTVFPDNAKRTWKNWEVEFLVLLSLILQILLVLLGNRRKYIGKLWIRVTLWSAYLLADWVATVALGVISQNTLDLCTGSDEESKYELMSFWAPFLLLHLGGPDAITAYSLEDNELWLRHLAGLVIQIGLAAYVLFVALPGSSCLPRLSIIVFVPGVIKYGERTWALRSANKDNFRDSMLTPPDPGPNYAKFMEEFTLRKAEGYYVEADEVKEISVPIDHSFDPAAMDSNGNHSMSVNASYNRYEYQGKLISEAFDQFQTFKRLFVDLILSFQDRDNSRSYFQRLKFDQAFRVVEIELGFAFDVFYTKAPVVYTAAGVFLRLTSFLFTCAAFIAFLVLGEAGKYRKIDQTITYLLLVVAILLEIYSVTGFLRSDWMDNWLNNRGKIRNRLISECLRKSSDELRWSNSMAQCNLVSICLEEKTAVSFRIQNLLGIEKFLEKHRCKRYEKVTVQLKDLIFERFKKFSENSDADPTALCTRRGSFALSERDYLEKLGWSTRVEFDKSILIWHIATDLCYTTDNPSDRDNIASACSKQISNYMLYLLVTCPFMLPIGIGLIRFRDTCAEAKVFFSSKEKRIGNDRVKACQKLLKVNAEIPPAKVKGDRSKSVLFDACGLARELQGAGENKWDLISKVWIEMLAHAATHCSGNHHAQQLRKGGELLTHVWLLMAHLGITEQFQIYQGHARAKLVAK